jgi:hypothetical protein
VVSRFESLMFASAAQSSTPPAWITKLVVEGTVGRR